MSKRALRNIKQWTALQPTTFTFSTRIHRCIPTRSLTTVVQEPPYLVPVEDLADAFDVARHHRLNDLKSYLSSDEPDLHRIWDAYVAFVETQHGDALPLEIHQQVLQQCTPPNEILRRSSARNLWKGNVPRAPHLYEGRFQTVIRNIRNAGQQPALEDFEFILGQFAAVGHHLGARRIFDELRQLGLKPRAKTYGLALQALAHRLTLPCLPSRRVRMKKDVTRQCMSLLNDMRARRIPFVSACVDLALRIVRETADDAGFDRLMKTLYGIDLAYTDSAPVEGLSGNPFEGGDGVTAPLPFSTAALNTTIDTLGRSRRISKMVEAFEVLTAPLPTRSEAGSTALDDDDDDFGLTGAADTAPRPFLAPSAEPNTTTYNMLIRWVSKHQHAPFARHYVWQMMCADQVADRALRNAAHNNVRLTEVIAPRVSVNRATFVPMFGLANHQKDMEALRWVLRMCKRTMKRKASHIEYYSAWAERILAEGGTLDADLPFEPIADDVTDVPAASVARPIPVEQSHTTSSGGEVPIDLSVCDISLEEAETAALPPANSPPPRKLFSLPRHLALLQKDLDELNTFHTHALDVHGKQVQRIKERLGRRVWREQDIWLRHTGVERDTVGRTEWKGIVGWRLKGAPGKNTWDDFWYSAGKR